MKINKMLASSIILLLAISSISIVLNIKTAEALLPPAPSLVVDDTINRVNATLGIVTGSQMTAKGTIKNIGGVTLTNLLTGVFFIEGTGVLVPADFSFEYSPDGITWFPINPSEVKVPTPAAAPMQVELVVGSLGGETLAPNATQTMYLRMTLNNNMSPIGWPTNIIQSMIVWVYGDTNFNRQYDGGEIIYSQPPAYAGLINWDNPVKIDLAIVHTAEIAGTGKFYYSIQSAINAASPGDTIYVYPGTYNEAVSINKAVQVLGSGASTTIIDGTGVVLGSTGLVQITASGDVKFDGFTVQNAPAVGGVFIGILSCSGIPGVTYTISYNNIYGTNNSSNSDDYGFYSSYDSANVVFTHNLITRTGANNIVFEIHTGTTEISYNTLDAGVYGSDAIFIMTYSGIDVTTLQNVHHNTINMGTGGPFDYSHRATGISFNTWPIAPDAKFTNVIIKSNTITNLQNERRGIGFWNGGGGGGGTIAPLIQSNTITGPSSPRSNNSYGIDFIGVGAAMNAVIKNNAIRYVDVGIFLRTAGSATGTMINYNSILDCKTYGVENVGAPDVDARYNWWGAAQGPYHPIKNPTGTTTSPVSDYVIFQPFDSMSIPPPLPEVHDIRVVTVTATPAIFSVGDMVSVDVYVVNLGTMFENFTLQVTYDSNVAFTTTVADLSPSSFAGEFQRHVIVSWNTAGVAPGPYVLNVTAVPVPGETVTSNNMAYTDIRAVAGAHPSLYVDPAVTNMQMIHKLFTVNVSVNIPTVDWEVTAFQFRLHWNTTLLRFDHFDIGSYMLDPRWNLNGAINITDLQTDLTGQYMDVGLLLMPGNNGWTVFPYGAGPIATFTFETIYQDRDVAMPPNHTAPQTSDFLLSDSLILDALSTALIPHSTTDGIYKMYPTNVADINKDYKVDMMDVGIAASAFGTTPNSSRWNPIADITGPTYKVPDGEINMRDIGLIASQFGWLPTYDP